MQKGSFLKKKNIFYYIKIRKKILIETLIMAKNNFFYKLGFSRRKNQKNAARRYLANEMKSNTYQNPRYENRKLGR